MVVVDIGDRGRGEEGRIPNVLISDCDDTGIGYAHMLTSAAKEICWGNHKGKQ